MLDRPLDFRRAGRAGGIATITAKDWPVPARTGGGSSGCFQEREWIAGRRNTDCSGWDEDSRFWAAVVKHTARGGHVDGVTEVREVGAWGATTWPQNMRPAG